MREVLEETGIQTSFLHIICFRHLHKFRNGLSDLYFVCALKPLSTEIKPDIQEIRAARWMKVMILHITEFFPEF